MSDLKERFEDSLDLKRDAPLPGESLVEHIRRLSGTPKVIEPPEIEDKKIARPVSPKQKERIVYADRGLTLKQITEALEALRITADVAESFDMPKLASRLRDIHNEIIGVGKPTTEIERQNIVEVDEEAERELEGK
jgi:hypothetical protein